MVKSRADVDTPALIRMHDGEWLDFAEVSGRLKIDGTHSGERFAVADFPHIPPHVLAAPLHRHHNEDEYTYVVDGSLGLQLGDAIVTANAGTWVIKPHRQWHTSRVRRLHVQPWDDQQLSVDGTYGLRACWPPGRSQNIDRRSSQ